MRTCKSCVCVYVYIYVCIVYIYVCVGAIVSLGQGVTETYSPVVPGADNAFHERPKSERIMTRIVISCMITQ